ncbi:TLC domain-containing protein 5-like [Colias croceus]|uniref:TLC domain-containing protein 5-like n=1 Tax=Colias crocea TaxID=72248 RepID=UPI001E27F98F|nr:TLC domain-containing protein 5-like [Colias croceus]
MAIRPELSTASLIKLSSFVCWTWSYVFCAAKFPGKSPEWYSRAVTLVHGTVATGAGLWQCGVFSLTRERLTSKITWAHYATMVWSWGYFAFDLLWCIIYWTESYVMLCHHICALIAINIYMSKEYTGCTFACTLALMEVTNPLLQTRWFLRYEGCNKNILYHLVEIVYLISFLTLRGIVGTYLTYRILHSDIFDMDEKLISLVFYIVSLIFISQIVGYVAYKYKTKIEEFKGFLVEIGLILNGHW